MIKIKCGNCLDYIDKIKNVDLILTDPPYTDYHTELYKQTPINFLEKFDCRQFVFWSAKTDFSLDYTAIHIWNKLTGVGSQYERIFERNGQKNWKVFSYYLINNWVAGCICKDKFYNHPSQKPLKLTIELIKLGSKPGDLVFDPFVGSGTTAVACKMTNRNFIGFEINPDYVKIAKERVNEINDPNIEKYF